MLRFALALAASVAALPAPAQPLTATETARLSGALYLEGLARDDALLLLAAAHLRKPIGFQQVDRVGDGGVAMGVQPLGWQQMLDRAEVAAAGDDALLGMIADARVDAGRGMASGPFYNIATLMPGTIDSYPAAAFRGGDYAEAYVEAQFEAAGTTDLNVAVYDAAGNLVCADTDPSPIAYCGWRPALQGDYVLKVENLGPDAASYSLMTN